MLAQSWLRLEQNINTSKFWHIKTQNEKNPEKYLDSHKFDIYEGILYVPTKAGDLKPISFILRNNMLSYISVHISILIFIKLTNI